ncbi:hypothetical protein GmHk_03G006802 [Glycine max]|nr:hypothetical protein GmHk_03G006802 [Glycine max]
MYHCVFSVHDSFEEQATQGSFVPYGRQDVLAAAIGRPEHPGRVRAAGDADPTDQGPVRGVHHRESDEAGHGILQPQGLAVPPEPLVGPSGPRVSTKGSCVDPSGNDPETEADLARLVAMGRVYEGSTIVHNTPLLPDQVKVSVEEVTDADAPVPVPTDEVSLVGQALHTFLAWPTHLVNAIKGLDDAPQPKSKASARWIVVKHFNNPRPLEPEILKALWIEWAQFYLRVRDQA